MISQSHWSLPNLDSKSKKIDFVHQTASCWETHVGWSQDYSHSWRPPPLPSLSVGVVYAHSPSPFTAYCKQYKNWTVRKPCFEGTGLKELSIAEKSFCWKSETPALGQTPQVHYIGQGSLPCYLGSCDNRFLAFPHNFSNYKESKLDGGRPGNNAKLSSSWQAEGAYTGQELHQYRTETN